MRWVATLALVAALGGACSSSARVSATCTPACGAGSMCVFKIGSCSAPGECVPIPDGGAATCGALGVVCGCGMNAVYGCGFPDGYASAPATGQGSCH